MPKGAVPDKTMVVKGRCPVCHCIFIATQSKKDESWLGICRRLESHVIRRTDKYADWVVGDNAPEALQEAV